MTDGLRAAPDWTLLEWLAVFMRCASRKDSAQTRWAARMVGCITAEYDRRHKDRANEAA